MERWDRILFRGGREWVAPEAWEDVPRARQPKARSRLGHLIQGCGRKPARVTDTRRRTAAFERWVPAAAKAWTQ